MSAMPEHACSLSTSLRLRGLQLFCAAQHLNLVYAMLSSRNRGEPHACHICWVLLASVVETCWLTHFMWLRSAAGSGRCNPLRVSCACVAYLKWQLLLIFFTGSCSAAGGGGGDSVRAVRAGPHYHRRRRRQPRAVWPCARPRSGTAGAGRGARRRRLARPPLNPPRCARAGRTLKHRWQGCRGLW